VKKYLNHFGHLINILNLFWFLFYSTGLAFQIPILQILIGLLNIVSPKQMLSAWRYIILISTILGAILTPSTDPLTQLLLSSAILLLYFSGLGILFLIKN
jgi:sec-independent protein translocase protein TatC